MTASYAPFKKSLRELNETRQKQIDELGSNPRAKSIAEKLAKLVSPVELLVYNWHIVDRLDVHAIVERLNLDGNRSYAPADAIEILDSARAKMIAEGEEFLARSSAEHARDAKQRYDSVIASMRVDLNQILDDPMMTGVRAKLKEMIVKAERTRDEVLAMFGVGDKAEGAGIIIYNSSLREPQDARVDKPIEAEIVDRTRVPTDDARRPTFTTDDDNGAGNARA